MRQAVYNTLQALQSSVLNTRKPSETVSKLDVAKPLTSTPAVIQINYCVVKYLLNKWLF